MTTSAELPRRLDQDPDRVRRRRVAKGWTGVQLAAEAGICPSVLSSIELGRRNASPRSLTSLARALGCEPEDLMAPERPSRKAA